VERKNVGNIKITFKTKEMGKNYLRENLPVIFFTIQKSKAAAMIIAKPEVKLLELMMPLKK